MKTTDDAGHTFLSLFSVDGVQIFSSLNAITSEEARILKNPDDKLFSEKWYWMIEKAIKGLQKLQDELKLKDARKELSDGEN